MPELTAREEIIARLRSAAPGGATGQSAAVVSTPAVSTWAARAERFALAARAASATVECVSTADAVAEALATYLSAQELPPGVLLDADPPGFAGPQGDRLRIESRPQRADGDTVVTGCFAALAEEGAVVMTSGAAHRAESCFLASTHVVVVEPQRLIDSMDALWARLRAAGDLPRLTNIILGPSRTADLGVPSRLGAHGPLRVHVILIAEPGPAGSSA